MRLAAGLCPDPLRELPQTKRYEGTEGMGTKGLGIGRGVRGGNGRA